MNVSEAAAGATKLTSPQESAKSRLKKAAAMAETPRKKFGLERTRTITLPGPERRHRAWIVPDLFHGASKDDVSNDGEEDDDENSGPGVEVSHRSIPIFSALESAGAATSSIAAPGPDF